MKVLKSLGLVAAVLVLCAGFGLVGSFLSQPSVHAASKHQASAAADQKPAPQSESVAAQTAHEATDLQQ